jgi:hypothetical protein
MSLRTYRRWIQAGGPVQADQRPDAKRPAPQNKLSDAEIKDVLAICNQPKYAVSIGVRVVTLTPILPV